MRLIQILLRPIYSLLYHQFAWAYDIVAACVSLGKWQHWIKAALPHLKGRVLEIGYGPGHLQVNPEKNSIIWFGLDESQQMGRQARRRIRKNGGVYRLTRGYAQNLPFANESFNSIVATFPSEFIFEFQTLKEIHRVITPAGRLVIIPTAWITGTRLAERMTSWIFRVSGESPGFPKPISATLNNRFMEAGFDPRSEIREMKGSQVLVILAEKR
jgi:ubiquinone/menaquinone biosynthesis C-methylase UbiE